MALQHTRLTEVGTINAAAAAIYTNPASTKSHVRGFLLHNTNTTSEEVSIYWVPDSGGSLGTATTAMRIFRVDLAADETLSFEIPYGLVLLDENETIQASATNSGQVTVVVLGDKDA